MTSSFREDLASLTLNNNYLLDLPNRKTNENVLVIKYSTPVAPLATRFVTNISKNPIEYKNSLNYKANDYGTNSDIKILTYLYFPDNEKNYQFRVTNGSTSSTSYPGEFSMYLNNYQYKIFDNTATNKTSNMDMVKKGVYLLCLEIPYNNNNFKIEYSNDSKTWLDLDKLLISNFTTSLDKKTLIDTFLISGLNYCNQDNINSTACNDFYKNIEDTTIENYLEEIQTSIYPTPIDGSYGSFRSWSVNDTNFQNIENINPLPTNRTNFKCGINIGRGRTRTYNPPKYGGNSNFEDEIYKTESKKSGIMFAQSQGAYTHQFEYKDVSCYTPNEINTQWKNIGCLTTSPPNNDSLKYLSYNADFANIKTGIDKWSYNKLLNTDDTTLIRQCYGNDGYFVVKSNRSNTKLYRGTEINNENGTKDIEVLVNGNFKIIFQKDGNLVLYNDTTKTTIWSARTHNKNATKLRMEHNGNLVIYTNNDTSLWNSKTNNNSGSYAELLSNGRFIIKNSKNTMIQYLLTKEFGGDNIYFSGSNNWKYAKNNSTDGILSDWNYYDNNGNLTVIKGKVTLKNDTQPWGMTNKDSSSDDRNKSEIKNPETVNGIDNIVHIVLLNKLGERIYIEPEIIKKLYTNNSKDNANGNISCSNRYYNAINAYNGDFGSFFTELLNSSTKLQNGLFNNEKNKGYRHPYIFYKDYGAWAWSKDSKTCTEWYSLAFDGNSQWGREFNNEKTALENDGFKPMNLDIKNHSNWLRDPRGSSEYSRYWRIYYRTQKDYVDYLNSSNSPFTNKSIFTNKLKASLLENYENPKCNLENLLTDSNCNSLEVNIYKDYINNMNKYCTGNWVNSLNPECVDYYNKSFIDSNNKSIKIDVEGKLKLLEIQEKACNNDNYFLNDRCIELNYSKSDIIKYQAKLCSDGKNKELCDELTKKYTNQVKKNISVNMLNDNKEVLYKNNLEKDILYLKCNENNNNVLLNNCNRLINDPNLSEEEKNNLINRKNELCTKTNINHSECIKYNKENPNILNELKNRCLQNKSDDCKEFCKNNKDDEEFKKTDFYKEVCYSWIEEFWWIILLIVLAILGGGFMYFKKKKTNNSSTSNTNSNTNKNSTS